MGSKNRDFTPKIPKFIVRIDTPDTAILGCYQAEPGQLCAIVGSIRHDDGELTTEALGIVGSPWAALAEALATIRYVGTANVLIATNSQDLMGALVKPFKPADCPESWDCIRLLGHHWGGHFRAIKTDELPKAKQLLEGVTNVK